MAEDILAGFSAKDIKTFHNEIKQFFRVAKELDRYYGKWHSDIDKYLIKYERWLGMFEKKYKGIRLKAVKRIDRLETKILLKEKDVKSVFENAASKIIGLKSVGANKFNVVDVTNSEGIMNEVARADKQLFITYYDPGVGARSLYLTFDEAEKIVRLNFERIRFSYESDEIILENSPDFKIACYYALKDGVNQDIDIFTEGATFGFDDLLSEREKAEWYHKMSTDYLE